MKNEHTVGENQEIFDRYGVKGTNHTRETEELCEVIRKLEDKRDRLREALKQYANKRNWKWTEYGLCDFHNGTNGPYIAVMALQEDRDG